MTKVVVPVLFAMEVADVEAVYDQTILFSEQVEEAAKAEIIFLGDPLTVSDEQVKDPDFGVTAFYGNEVLLRHGSG